MSNHLGNVLATVSDRKIQVDDGYGSVDYYRPDIQSTQDYYPFGSLMPGRQSTPGEYAFGFNGKEKDDAWKGSGNSYDYGFRIYNPQIGRFLSVDPLFKSYPCLTPYQFAANMPLWAVDIDGLEALIVNKNDNTVTFVANVYFVTQGEGNVDVAALRKATEDLLVNQLSETARTISGTTYKFEINYITEDSDGNPLTYEKAGELAEKSQVEHTTSSGEKIVIEGPETGVVVHTDDKMEGTNPGKFIPKEINKDGNFNLISINKDVSNQMDQTEAGQSFVHELGHYLGRRGLSDKEDHAGGFEGTDPGVTSRKNKNIRLIPNDLTKMASGAYSFGKTEVVQKEKLKPYE